MTTDVLSYNKKMQFLPVELGRAERSGRGATASLKADRLCEATRELEGGSLEPRTGEQNEGWRVRIGGQSTPLSLLQIHLSPTIEIQRENICLDNCWATINFCLLVCF